jgi:hypothetical protein
MLKPHHLIDFMRGSLIDISCGFLFFATTFRVACAGDHSMQKKVDGMHKSASQLCRAVSLVAF